mmetsp:Transcript_6848/g.10385  ORF Transcript_6848/g.10385 Transcript_6848/m.10385 type:complete len:93 (-) Transcript_6848:20-298(-)
MQFHNRIAYSVTTFTSITTTILGVVPPSNIPTFYVSQINSRLTRSYCSGTRLNDLHTSTDGGVCMTSLLRNGISSRHRTFLFCFSLFRDVAK